MSCKFKYSYLACFIDGRVYIIQDIYLLIVFDDLFLN